MSIIPDLKYCPKCGETKPVAEFGRNARSKDGRATRCLECMRAYDRVRNTTPERQAYRKERQQQQIDLNTSEKLCTRCGQSKSIDSYTRDGRYQDGRYPYCADCRREWRQGRKGKQRELHRNWTEQNRDQVRKLANQGYARNKDKIAPKRRIYDRIRYQNDPEVRRRKNRQTAEKNRRRRAILYGAPAEHHTEEEWQALCAKYDHRCLRCGKQVPLTRDHIVPVTKQGSDAIWNIQPLCGPCNSIKNDKIIDFRPPE